MINGRIAAHDPTGADFISMGDNEIPDANNAPKVPWETPGTMNCQRSPKVHHLIITC
jgi:hypothetical protein